MGRNLTGGLAALLALLACGSGGDGGDARPAPAPRAAQNADTAARASQTDELRREVFSYRGGTRDPFESLLTSALVGPELADLTLVGISIDHANPGRSVATLRERITDRRYNLNPGDRLGRIRVVAIREQQVDFVIDDFGTERRETLTLRRSQEDDTP
jgi:hypothetical protein